MERLKKIIYPVFWGGIVHMIIWFVMFLIVITAMVFYDYTRSKFGHHSFFNELAYGAILYGNDTGIPITFIPLAFGIVSIPIFAFWRDGISSKLDKAGPIVILILSVCLWGITVPCYWIANALCYYFSSCPGLTLLENIP